MPISNLMLGKDFEYKRKFPRRLFYKRVGVLFKGVYFIGTGLEIGEGGMALTLPKSLPFEHELVLNFQIPDGGFVSVRSDVRNCVDQGSGFYKVGLAFKNIKFFSKRQIRSYVSNRSESESLAI